MTRLLLFKQGKVRYGLHCDALQAWNGSDEGPGGKAFPVPSVQGATLVLVKYTVGAKPIFVMEALAW